MSFVDGAELNRILNYVLQKSTIVLTYGYRVKCDKYAALYMRRNLKITSAVLYERKSNGFPQKVKMAITQKCSSNFDSVNVAQIFL